MNNRTYFGWTAWEVTAEVLMATSVAAGLAILAGLILGVLA